MDSRSVPELRNKRRRQSFELGGYKFELSTAVHRCLNRLAAAAATGDGWVAAHDLGRDENHARVLISRLREELKGHPELAESIESGPGRYRLSMPKAQIGGPSSGTALANSIRVRNFEAFPFDRVVIVSPHPDDSVLGCGGLINKLVTHRGPQHARPVQVTIVVITPGYRGVEDQYLAQKQMLAEDAVRDWLNLRPEDVNTYARLVEAMKARLGERFDAFGRPGDSDRDRAENVLKTAIRFSETRDELEALRLNRGQLEFLALPHLYNRLITRSELVSVKEAMQRASASGQNCLILLPHPDDPQPAHQAVTEATVRAIGTDVDWTIWYYQSPWFTMRPTDIDVIVPMDFRDLGAKKEGARKHESQGKRTPYVDFVESSARIVADVVPEVLLGFGGKRFRVFGEYCEVYSMRMRSFYGAGDRVAYSETPIAIEQAPRAPLQRHWTRGGKRPPG